ncbi:MAG: hypothetical protein U9R54_06630 [Bacteroidota bacterium]|nr:hypothetical protein [Bacteroidota bacterium]
MKKLKLIILVFAIIIAFASCEDDETDVIITENEVTENITTNTTWETNNVYIIDGTLYIDGATLTIEAGTTIKFKEGAQINIGYSETGSAIIANGTADDPILFTAYAEDPSAGDWDALFFESGTARTTSLNYCTFEYGGGYSTSYGIIDLYDAEISITNCTITNSENYGISLNSDSKFSSFINNTISSTASHVIKLYPNAAHTIGAGNIFETTNPSIGILVSAGTYNQTEETWLAQTVSYIIDGTMYLENNAGSILNIEEGTTVAFTKGSQINVGYRSSTYGTIKANGTETNPITFTSSATSKTPGDWDALFLDDGTSDNSIFSYCTFEYGGGYSSSYGIIDLYDCSVSFNNCTFTNSETFGISLNGGSSFESFNNNAFSACVDHPIKLYANYAHTVGTGNTYDSDLGILVKADTYEQTSETWKKQSCAYYIDGTMDIGSSSGSELFIEAGSKIYFTEGSQINVGNSSSTYGKIVAQGTSQNRIIFTSSAPLGSASAGDWDSIFLDSGTSAGTIFDNCDFSYGGGYSSSYGIIDLDDTGTNVTISNSTFSYSASHGISVDSDSNPTINGNTFSNIAGDNIYNN